MQLEVGVVIADRYRLDAKLGAGGMAVVWAATHVVTRKTVALKFLAREYTAHQEARARFVREARAASMVDHANVVAIHDVVELPGGRLVMVMDRLVGETLRERLDRERTLPLGEVARLMLPVISAAGTAHAVGVVHRDLKPDNIFLTTRPAGVRVLDFGIAKLTKKSTNPSDLTVTGSVLGTPHYMAPEQIFGERDVDAGADVWAIGVILFECLTGAPPFKGDNPGQILKAILQTDAPPLVEQMRVVPENLNELVGRMLLHDRRKRPADLCEIFEVLQEHSQAAARAFGPAQAPITVFNTDPDATPNPFTDTAISSPGLASAPDSTGLDDRALGDGAAGSSGGLGESPAPTDLEDKARSGDTALSAPEIAERSTADQSDDGSQIHDTAVPFSKPLSPPGRSKLTAKLTVGAALVATAVGTWALVRSQSTLQPVPASSQLAPQAQLVAAVVLGEQPRPAAATVSPPTGSAPASRTASAASSAPVAQVPDKPPDQGLTRKTPPGAATQTTKPGKLPAGVYGDLPF